jgi:hypothetical protein
MPRGNEKAHELHMNVLSASTTLAGIGVAVSTLLFTYEINIPYLMLLAINVATFVFLVSGFISFLKLVSDAYGPDYKTSIVQALIQPMLWGYLIMIAGFSFVFVRLI